MQSDSSQLVERHLRLLRQHDKNGTDLVQSIPLVASKDLHSTKDELQSLAQYGLLAGILSPTDTDRLASHSVMTADDRLFFNTTSPSSTFICGAQGSGKSHTLSCLLENCLQPSDAAVLPHPLTALVFHYDTFISDDGGSPCEAAYLSSLAGVRVRVLCSPTNIRTIRMTYSRFNIEVQPLSIGNHELNTKRMLELMAVNPEDTSVPLYIHVVYRILRDMRLAQQATGAKFQYYDFKDNLAKSGLTPQQLAPLHQRLSVLESFLSSSPAPRSKKGKKHSHVDNATTWTNEPGLITIVDLSCPCITPETACSLFNVCLGLFLEKDILCGRVVALDEAHKYMTSSPEAATFTATLLSTIRLQRHLGVRVMIATQEPTVAPTLLDLCSVVIIHRFTSPAWLRVLVAHTAVHREGLTQEDHQKTQVDRLFEAIITLRTGEALCFTAHTNRQLQWPLKLRIRARLSEDGGQSVLAQ